MSSPFKRAERRAVKLRAAIDGPTGSGKTISSLRIARGLVGPAGSIAVIDTEHGTSEKFYADVIEGGFDMAPLTKYQPTDYVSMIEAAHGYDCLIIDSLSHAWSEGVLSMVDAKGGKFDAWKHVTPHHNRLVNALLTYPGHLIVTMRSKMAYEVSKDDKSGKTTVEKLGLKPVQREGLEYEFDLVMDMDQAHRLTVSKSRMRPLSDRSVIEPDEKFGIEIAGLVSVGIPERVESADLAKSRARELVGMGDSAEIGAVLKAAGISSAELADDEVWEEARRVVTDLLESDAPDMSAFIDAAGMRKVHAKGRDAGLDHDDLHALALEVFPGIESTKQVPAAHMDDFLAAIETRGAELAAQAEAA